jgi:hypothetical protein
LIEQNQSIWYLNDECHRLNGPVVNRNHLQLYRLDEFGRLNLNFIDPITGPFILQRYDYDQTGCIDLEKFHIKDPYNDWIIHGKVYWKFDHVLFLYFQILIRFLYFCENNRNVWSPKYLGGEFTKMGLFNMVSKKRRLNK